MNESVNPYAPPQATVARTSSDEAEVVRHELLKHETSIKSIGTLYLIGFAFVNMAALFGAIALLQYYLGRGLRRLESGVRIPVTVLSAIGLIGFPVGTLINGYILYLLHSAAGRRIMTPDYQEIIASTPHIKYRTPAWLLVLVVLLILIPVVIVVIAAMG